ncbi:unnamed protein product [Litomosoides sigmodontis]|uniref:Uncharacterized protein n=1 Tax=Litomosoides sigmodontis TaxID=42156 RepID=A0A3P6TE03_LITSI|nr:unnamed protein product [Litomosoides sigmodontis]
MPKGVPSEPEFTAIGTSENGEDLITGVSVSQEKLTNHTSKDVRKSSKDQFSQAFFFNDDFAGQRYAESAKLPEIRHIPDKKIVWKRTQNVLEVPILGHFRTYEKRVERSRPNPWRRHGALLKIYEIGGWISRMEKRQMSRRDRKYFYVKAGTKPCNPPSRPPISIRESKFLAPSSINIPTVMGRSVDELSFLTAVHIQEATRNAVSLFLESHQAGIAERDGINLRNSSKSRSGGRSSSAPRLPTHSGAPSGKSLRSRSFNLLIRKSR